MSSSVSLEYLNTVLPSSGDVGFTAIGGIYITLINDTGATSVLGSIVSASLTTNNACRLAPAYSDEPIGVIAEAGVLNGDPVKVVVGGKAYVLMKNGQTASRGEWIGVSDVAGRAYFQPEPPEIITHWGEVGHCIESVSSGTDKVALGVLHFN